MELDAVENSNVLCWECRCMGSGIRNFQWSAYQQVKQQLAGRLADASNLCWTDSENGLYLIEALRTLNALTEIWNADFAFSPQAPQVWYNVPTLPNSPRVRTVTDA